MADEGGATRVYSERKTAYAKKLKSYLDEYTQVLIATVDNIGSKQLQEARISLRGKAEFLYGKNTMIRKIIRDYSKETGNEQILKLAEIVQGNSCMVFTKESIIGIRDTICEKEIQASAKAGTIAPQGVSIPAGPTGQEPTMTSFFQSLNIATKINRGQIDIVNPVELIVKGDKVGESQAALLSKLGIRPFYYKILVTSVYDNGNVYSSDVLDITPADVAQAFFFCGNKMAALCLEIDYPTAVSVPHSILSAYKNCLSVGLALENYSWDNLKLVKEILANPDAFRGGGGGGGGGAAAGGGEAAAAPEPEEEEEESSAAAPQGGGLFGSDSGSSSDSSS